MENSLIKKLRYLLFVVVCAMFACMDTSCSRKTYHQITKYDTLIVYHSDTIFINDTISKVLEVVRTDSVIERLTTYIVVDSAGNVKEKQVYRDKSVYHNKDALRTNSHANNVQRVRNSKEKQTTISTEQKKVAETTALHEAQKFAFYTIMTVAIIAIIYYYIYKKRK